MQAAGRILCTEDEYLEHERLAEDKSEFIDGEIVAMAGAAPKHNAIAVNVLRALGNRLAGRRCTVLNSDQRVHVPETGLFTYPDASIVCDRPKLNPKDKLSLLNPKVIVEVLSPSTADYDHGAKFAHYRSIASLEEYVMVWQEQERVEHFRKIEPRQWVLTDHVGVDATLIVLGLAVPLAEIYADLDLLEDAGEQEGGQE